MKNAYLFRDTLPVFTMDKLIRLRSLLFLALCGCAASTALTPSLRISEQATLDSYYSSKAIGAPFRASLYDSVADFGAEHPAFHLIAEDVASARTGDSTGAYHAHYYALLLHEIDIKFKALEAKP